MTKKPPANLNLITVTCVICGLTRTGPSSQMRRTSICGSQTCRSEFYRRLWEKRNGRRRMRNLLVCLNCGRTFVHHDLATKGCNRHCSAILANATRKAQHEDSLDIVQFLPESLLQIPDPYETIYD